MKARLLPASVAFALAVLVVTPLAVAPSLTGLFVVYRFSVTTGATDYTGTWRQEVLQELADGRVELRMEVEAGETQFVVERNVTADSVHFPILPPIPGLEFTFAREAANLSVSIPPEGQAGVAFQGAEHTVNGTHYSVRAVVGNATTPHEIMTSGRAQAFPSGLLYAVEGEFVLAGDQPRTASYRLLLEATNLPLDAASATSSALAFFPSLGNEPARPAEPASRPAVQAEALWALGGAVAVVGAFVYLSLGRRRKPASDAPAGGEKPPHWVP